MCRNIYKINELILSILFLILIQISCAPELKINVPENNDKSDFIKEESAENQKLLLPNDKKDCIEQKFIENPQLLIKTMYPGFTPGGVNGELDRIVILVSGKVMRGHRDSYHTPWHDQVVGELSPDVLADLKNKLCSLAPGKISFPDDSAVTDAPSTHYEAPNSEGEMVTFFEYSGGRWGKLESFQWAEELRMLVDSFK
jgi:hypothetical protein